MLARILWFVVVVVLFSVFKKIISSFFGGPGSSNKNTRPSHSSTGTKAISGKTFRDPVCGTHVAASIALSESVGDETIFFCSEKCRKAYLESREPA